MKKNMCLLFSFFLLPSFKGDAANLQTHDLPEASTSPVWARGCSALLIIIILHPGKGVGWREGKEERMLSTNIDKKEEKEERWREGGSEEFKISESLGDWDIQVE